MRFDVISIFPEIFAAIRDFGVTSRAFQQNLAQLHVWNLRDFTQDAHRTVDDRPFGGGPGMVMKAEPLALATEAVIAQSSVKPLVIMLSPQGRVLNQQLVTQLMQQSSHWCLVSGRYEGIDQRYIDTFVDVEISLGDFVVSGGELPAMLLMDAALRLIPGVLGHEDSAVEDSFQDGLLDCPHYTRPAIWRGIHIPKVLQSGHHLKIKQWRDEVRSQATAKLRPDLWDRYQTPQS